MLHWFNIVVATARDNDETKRPPFALALAMLASFPAMAADKVLKIGYVKKYLLRARRLLGKQ